MNDIDVVVVTYNRVDLLRECIHSLEKQKKNINKVYVINNNSTDGTFEYLQEISNFDLFHVENLKTNIGGAKGFELGVKLAFQGNGKYVWIMDDDTIPTETASDELLIKANQLDDDFGFLCSNVKWTNGEPTNIPTPDAQWTDKAEEGLVKVINATFVSIMLKKQSIEKLGLPIGAMKIWGDDTEYTTRLSQRNSSYLVTTSIVIHKTVNNLANDQVYNINDDRIWRIKTMYRNLIFINRKYRSKKDLVKFLLKGILDICSCFRAKTKKFSRMWSVISGIVNGFFFNPKINFPNTRNFDDEINEISE